MLQKCLILYLLGLFAFFGQAVQRKHDDSGLAMMAAAASDPYAGNPDDDVMTGYIKTLTTQEGWSEEKVQGAKAYNSRTMEYYLLQALGDIEVA